MPGEIPRAVAFNPPPALKQPPTAPAADEPITEVVPDDRRGGRDDDDHRDVVVALRREHAERDQRCLPGERDPERLEHDHEEEERQPVMGDEMRQNAHLAPRAYARYGRSGL